MSDYNNKPIMKNATYYKYVVDISNDDDHDEENNHVVTIKKGELLLYISSKENDPATLLIRTNGHILPLVFTDKEVYIEPELKKKSRK